MEANTATQKITPFLWFDNNAEEAVNFYLSIFKDAKITNLARYSSEGAKAAQMPEGSAMTIAFNLNGQNFVALNGGPVFKFSEAVSFVVNCASQDEVDHYWNNLTEGGKESQCGWLKDKFGLSWQIVPKQLEELMSSAKGGKVMAAMLKMKKIVIKDLEDAVNL